MASLGHNIIANFVGRTWVAVLSILLTPVYLRLVGIEAYGLIGLFGVLVSLTGVLDLGIGGSLNRELARLSAVKESATAQRDVVRTLELLYVGIAVCAGAVVVLLGPYLTRTWIQAQTLGSGSVLKAVQLMGVSIALQFPMSFYQGGLMGMQRQVLVNAIVMFIGTLRSVGATLILWLISPTIEAFFIWQIILSAIGSLIFFVAIWRSLPRQPGRAHFRTDILKRIWRYAAAFSANAIIGVIMSQLDKIILTRMLTLRMFGYYSLAAMVASSIWMITFPVNTAVFPRFVQLHEINDKASVKVLFHRSSQTLSLLLLPVCALLIVFSREILSLWSRDPAVVDNCHLIVSLLVFGTMLNGLTSVPCYSAAAFGWPQLITYTNALQTVVMIPLIISLVYWYKGVGAAMGWIALNCTYLFLMVPFYFRRFLREERWSWYSYDIAVPAVVAFAICLISHLFSPAIHGRLATSAFLLVTGLMATAATALVLPYVRGLICSFFPARLYGWANAA